MVFEELKTFKKKIDAKKQASREARDKRELEQLDKLRAERLRQEGRAKTIAELNEEDRKLSKARSVIKSRQPQFGFFGRSVPREMQEVRRTPAPITLKKKKKKFKGGKKATNKFLKPTGMAEPSGFAEPSGRV